MKDRGKIVLIYSTVAIVSALIVGFAIHLGRGLPEQPSPFVDTGSPKEEIFFPIARDLSGVNQAGQPVKLSELKGKVWLVAEFFAVCPHCALRNGQEMKGIQEAFKDDPDFHIVCVSVDPKADTVEHLQGVSTALEADPARWWFFNAGDEKATHDYLEHTLKFFGIRERSDPADIEANGRFAHDMGFMLVDREWNVVGKWPLADARTEEGRRLNPQLYEQLKEDLYRRIRQELAKKSERETAGVQ